MTKKVRITLYIVSLVITTAVLVLLIFNEKILRPSYSGEANIPASGQVSTDEVGDNQITDNTEQGGTTHRPGNSGAGRGETTTIVFAGDVLIAEAMEQYYDAKGVTRLVSEELLAEMQNADICMVNNEFQFSTQGTPMEDKQFTFRTEPKYVQIMLDMGVDIVNANIDSPYLREFREKHGPTALVLEGGWKNSGPLTSMDVEEEVLKGAVDEYYEKFAKDGSTGIDAVDELINNYLTYGTTGNPELDKVIMDYVSAV